MIALREEPAATIVPASDGATSDHQSVMRRVQQAWPLFWNLTVRATRKRIVCDSHSGTKAAIRSLWPTTEIYLCDWHIQAALMRLIDKIIRQKPRSRTVLAPLRDAVPAHLLAALRPSAAGSERATP